MIYLMFFIYVALLWGLVAATDKSIYQRRRGHSIAILNNRLYIDGGYISNYVDEIPPEEAERERNTNNMTVIPLDTDWTSLEVTKENITYPSDVLTMEYSALWAHANESELVRWGGQRPRDENMNDTSSLFWRIHTPDTSISWDSEIPKYDRSSDYLPGVYGSSTTCAGLDLYFGGESTPGTYIKTTSKKAIEGVASYSPSTQKWERHTDQEGTLPGPFGTHKVGQAICLEGFTSSPLVVLFGGTHTNTQTMEDSTFGLQTLYLYDPVQYKWYSQNTTNYPQGGRDNFCAVGAKGKNGTFEIYMYGGDFYGTRGDVCILTLPGFHWECPQEAVTDSRLHHKCVLAGERQMISVGGVLTYSWMNDSDPWPNGLGVLDLPTLSWRPSYDANAGPYDSPSVIKEWYAENQNQETNWSDPAIKAYFSSNETGPPPAPNPSETKKDQGPMVGAIVGGTLGGLALLTLFLSLWWYIRRKRSAAAMAKEAQEQQQHQIERIQAKMVPSDGSSADQIPLAPVQLDAGYRGVQLEGTPRSELDKNEMPWFELNGRTQLEICGSPRHELTGDYAPASELEGAGSYAELPGTQHNPSEL